MTKKQIEGELYDLSFYSSMNQCYHQKLMAKYGRREMRLKLGLGFITCFSFALTAYAYGAASAPASGWPLAELRLLLSFISLVAAVALNIVQYGSKERKHAELYARWTELYREVAALEARLKHAPKEKWDDIVARLPDLVSRRSHIELDEPPADRKLADECQQDENERRWGVRTNEEVERIKAERQNHALPPAAQPPVPQPAAPPRPRACSPSG